MPHVDVYTRPFCPYCIRAKRLLNDQGIAFNEIDIQSNAVAEAEMRTRSGRTSVPQIFIDGHHVGGSDELVAADKSGKLSRLIDQAA